MADASTNVRGFQDIPHFQIEEIQRVLKQMSSRKTGAVDGVAGKIFKYGNVVLHSCLWNIYNILQQYVCWILRIFRNRGNTPFSRWYQTGGTTALKNWGWIAILTITYIFLNNYCWNEWTPFWTGNNARIKRVSSHVLLLKFLNMFLQYLYKCVCGKSLEWNAPVWFANLELTTALAFDRVEYSVRCWIGVCQPLIVHYLGPCISTSKEHFVMGLHFQSNVGWNKAMSSALFFLTPLCKQQCAIENCIWAIMVLILELAKSLLTFGNYADDLLAYAQAVEDLHYIESRWFHYAQFKKKWKARTRMYSRSWIRAQTRTCTNTFHYYRTLQNLQKHIPVQLCTTKFAQSTSLC